MANNNAAVFNSLLKKQSNSIIKPKIAVVLRKVATWMTAMIDKDFQPADGGGNDKFPVWYGQLHDATGVGVYMDGVLTAYIPTAWGTYKQHTDSEKDIVGGDYLQDAINMAAMEFPKGFWIVLFSTVPYAYEVNVSGSPWGRGVGFFETMENQLKGEVFANLRAIAPSKT